MAKLHEELVKTLSLKADPKMQADLEKLKGLDWDFSTEVDLKAGLRDHAIWGAVAGFIKIGPFSIPVKFEKLFPIDDQEFHFEYPKS